MQDRIRAWINEHLVKGFYRAHSWLLNLFGFLVVVLPDILNYAVSNIDSFVGSIPTLSIQHKLTILAAVNVLSLVVKAWKQKNGPIAIAEREGIDSTQVFAQVDMAAIIREVEKHFVDSLEKKLADIPDLSRYSQADADRVVVRNVYTHGGIARETAGIIGEDGPEAFIPARRSPEGGPSTDGPK